MAKRAPKKKTAKKKKKAVKKKALFRFFSLLMISTFVILSVGALIYFTLFQETGSSPATSSRKVLRTPSHKQKPVLPYEEPDPPSFPRPREADAPTVPPPPKPRAVAPPPENIPGLPARPKLAIIIDDMGHHASVGRRLLALDLPLTFAFLPYAPHTGELLRVAQERGRAIMLHIPMEPTDLKWDPGPDALYLNMSDTELREAFARNLAAVPMAIGVNNHMGSRFTQNQEAMHVFLEEVRRHHIFYVDSITTPYSVGRLVAQTLGVTTGERDIFLDNVQDRKAISRQLEALIRVAEKQGYAIGIGHPYDTTLAALKAYQKQLRTRVELVPIHELVR